MNLITKLTLQWLSTSKFAVVEILLQLRFGLALSLTKSRWHGDFIEASKCTFVKIVVALSDSANLTSQSKHLLYSKPKLLIYRHLA